MYPCSSHLKTTNYPSPYKSSLTIIEGQEWVLSPNKSIKTVIFTNSDPSNSPVWNWSQILEHPLTRVVTCFWLILNCLKRWPCQLSVYMRWCAVNSCLICSLSSIHVRLEASSHRDQIEERYQGFVILAAACIRISDYLCMGRRRP